MSPLLFIGAGIIIILAALLWRRQSRRNSAKLAAPPPLSATSLDPPSPIIQTMYLEITNISQGINIGLFVFIIVEPSFFNSVLTSYYATPFFAISSLMMSMIFWTRFYFDTEILKRSFSQPLTTLFFLFAIAMGINILSMKIPQAWLFSAVALLLCGVGFYAFNIGEIRRKQKAGILLTLPAEYTLWQQKRLVDLLFLAVLSLASAWFVQRHPPLSLPAALASVLGAFWQFRETGAYRAQPFLKTGL